MTLTNTHTHYGLVTRTLHWATAIGIFMVIPLGVIAHRMSLDPTLPGDPERVATVATLFSLHKTIGLTIFFVALARIAWAIAQPKPAPVSDDPRWQRVLAATVHYTLYGSLVLVPLMGWIHHAATTGFAPIWWPFGQSLPFVPKDPVVAERFATLHMFFERVLLVSLILHIAGAVKHHVVDKDATLRRMCGTPDINALAPHRSSLAAPVIAASAFILVGLAALLQPVEGRATVAATLAPVSSDWQVQEGSLGIEVTQFGNAVTGSFADWTAAISFDERAPADNKGDVTVTIAIGSLTLGSVTDQALGPDFFDAGAFPTAVFTGVIREDGAAYVADGELTIRDVTQPLSLPFTLALDGDTAVMEGATTLDRLAFGIGESLGDERTLAFPVDVTVSLTAMRGE
ncbi:MAG: cytochrome b/b6 domain-containing protein [Shimia sp.]